VALGSNLGDSPAIIARALDRLQELSEQPIARSSLWRSAPIDCPPGSPPFTNAVAEIVPRPDETAETLLSKLQALEKEFGRLPKTVMNEPRPLDLDLIAFGQRTCATALLTLPHPRAHCRRFVLQPLAELAPDLILPGQTKTVLELLASLGEDQPSVVAFGSR
jgi:2-amino-4-hydroxy-6-hydroxymethyldihydropteridine diphosphokinase